MTTFEGARLWLAILAIGAGTFAIRFSFIYFFGRAEVPPPVMRLLRYVPPAVLAALILPAVLLRQGHLAATWENERLWAALLAAGVAWRWKNMLLTIGAGMGGLWLLQMLGA